MQKKLDFLSREQLQSIIADKDIEIKSLKRDRHNNRVDHHTWWLVISAFFAVYTIMLFIVIDINKPSESKGAICQFLALSLIVSSYSIYKVFKSSRRVRYNDDTIKNEWIIEKDKLVQELSTVELQDRLDESIHDENYDLSIILRDELKKRVK